MINLVQTEQGVILPLIVQANSPRNVVVGEHNGALKIKIHAPPVDGKANAEIEAFLAEILGIGKNRVEILKGSKSKIKKVLIRGFTMDQLLKLLS